jgi:hypothetical protein
VVGRGREWVDRHWKALRGRSESAEDDSPRARTQGRGAMSETAVTTSENRINHRHSLTFNIQYSKDLRHTQ